MKTKPVLLKMSTTQKITKNSYKSKEVTLAQNLALRQHRKFQSNSKTITYQESLSYKSKCLKPKQIYQSRHKSTTNSKSNTINSIKISLPSSNKIFNTSRSKLKSKSKRPNCSKNLLLFNMKEPLESPLRNIKTSLMNLSNQHNLLHCTSMSLRIN